MQDCMPEWRLDWYTYPQSIPGPPALPLGARDLPDALDPKTKWQLNPFNCHPDRQGGTKCQQGGGRYDRVILYTKFELFTFIPPILGSNVKRDTHDRPV